MNEEQQAVLDKEITAALGRLGRVIDAQIVALAQKLHVQDDPQAYQEVEKQYLGTIAEVYRDATRGWYTSEGGP